MRALSVLSSEWTRSNTQVDKHVLVVSCFNASFYRVKGSEWHELQFLCRGVSFVDVSFEINLLSKNGANSSMFQPWVWKKVSPNVSHHMNNFYIKRVVKWLSHPCTLSSSWIKRRRNPIEYINFRCMNPVSSLDPFFSVSFIFILSYWLTVTHSLTHSLTGADIPLLHVSQYRFRSSILSGKMKQYLIH